MGPRTQPAGGKTPSLQAPSSSLLPAGGDRGFRIFRPAAQQAGRNPRGARSAWVHAPPTNATGTLLLPRSSGPRGPRNAPGKFRGGLTQDAGWGPLLCLRHPLFVPLSPGLMGQPLQSHLHQSWAQAACGCLLTDTRAGSGRTGQSQPHEETAQGILHLLPRNHGERSPS